MTNATTDEDTQTTSGLIISRNAADGAEVTHFKITGITNGTLFKNDGLTPITDGTFITVAEGNAGLKFTPTADFSGSGSFTIQASTSSGDAGLGGSTVIATVTVNAVNDAPVITSDGGGASATISIAENLTAASTVTSTTPMAALPSIALPAAPTRPDSPSTVRPAFSASWSLPTTSLPQMPAGTTSTMSSYR